MVKGVNKTVIEVNNTGSRYFEKIVFYVTPQYGNLSAKQLKKAAGTFSFDFDNTMSQKPLRQRHKQRKIVTFGLLVLGAAVLTVGLIILL